MRKHTTPAIAEARYSRTSSRVEAMRDRAGAARLARWGVGQWLARRRRRGATTLESLHPRTQAAHFDKRLAVRRRTRIAPGPPDLRDRGRRPARNAAPPDRRVLARGRDDPALRASRRRDGHGQERPRRPQD